MTPIGKRTIKAMAAVVNSAANRSCPFIFLRIQLCNGRNITTSSVAKNSGSRNPAITRTNTAATPTMTTNSSAKESQRLINAFVLLVVSVSSHAYCGGTALRDNTPLATQRLERVKRVAE
jgi:hypothetical protein